jgi:homoserine kinase
MRIDSLPPSVQAVIAVARESGAYAASLTGGGIVALTPFRQGDAVASAMMGCAQAEGLAGRSLATEVQEAGVQVKTIEPDVPGG